MYIGVEISLKTTSSHLKMFKVSSWLSLILCLGVGYIINKVGPDLFAKQLVAFYEKPQSTLAPVYCMVSQCGAPLTSCLSDINCRNTAGKTP